MNTHRTLDGEWAECSAESCPLKFHFPDMTPEQMAAMPLHLLLPLFEIVNPPSRVLPVGKVWHDGILSTVYHRDYDLPAIIRTDGSMEWWQYDNLHRDSDKPARIAADGRLEWWINGRQLSVQQAGSTERMPPRKKAVDRLVKRWV